MDTKARDLVCSLKQICRREGLKVFEPKAGRCAKHAVVLERSGKNWLCWDCQLELAAHTSGCLMDSGDREITVDGALNLFGPSYWKR